MRTPTEDWIELVLVEGQFDAADDYIVDHLETDDIVITADIPLAARCLDSGPGCWPDQPTLHRNEYQRCLASTCSPSFDAGSLGPPPFQKRSLLFLQQLDRSSIDPPSNLGRTDFPAKNGRVSRPCHLAANAAG
jgi:hypothetical protein